MDADAVAAAAGVDVPTLLRALRGMPSVNVDDRNRVRAAVLGLGVTTDELTAPLRHGPPMLLGVPDVQGWYFGAVAAGVEAACALARRRLVVVPAPPGPAREALVEDLLRDPASPAVLVDVPLPLEHATWLVQRSRPVVAVGTASGLADRVVLDDAGAARRAAEHVLALGHTRIAVVGATPSSEDAFAVNDLRVSGFRAALDDAGVALPTDMVAPCDASAAGGRAGGADLLARFPRPTAILATTDVAALGVLHAARELGVHVPDELTVVGFDDAPFADAVGLTTVGQRPSELGLLAATAAFGREDGARAAVDVVVDAELVVRRTSARPATGRFRVVR